MSAKRSFPITRLEKPMSFQDWGVRAIFDGTKTQTRRVIKPQPVLSSSPVGSFEWHFGARLTKAGYGAPYVHTDSMSLARIMEKFAPHPVGSFIWVRETWQEHSVIGFDRHGLEAEGDYMLYRADDIAGHIDTGWRSPRYMPRWASRLLLEVTDVRVQRMQGITEEDAKAEGIKAEHLPANEDHPDCICYVSQPDDNRAYVTRRDAFAATWDVINAKRGLGWDVNPWVFAYTFKKVQP